MFLGFSVFHYFDSEGCALRRQLIFSIMKTKWRLRCIFFQYIYPFLISASDHRNLYKLTQTPKTKNRGVVNEFCKCMVQQAFQKCLSEQKPHKAWIVWSAECREIYACK